jgi:hypothetical protein
MPRYSVEHENKWACFSSIVDDFITEFMPLDEYESWRKAEYGNMTVDLSKANKMSYEEALETINLNKSEVEKV